MIAELKPFWIQCDHCHQELVIEVKMRPYVASASGYHEITIVPVGWGQLTFFEPTSTIGVSKQICQDYCPTCVAAKVYKDRMETAKQKGATNLTFEVQTQSTPE